MLSNIIHSNISSVTKKQTKKNNRHFARHRRGARYPAHTFATQLCFTIWSTCCSYLRLTNLSHWSWNWNTDQSSIKWNIDQQTIKNTEGRKLIEDILNEVIDFERFSHQCYHTYSDNNANFRKSCLSYWYAIYTFIQNIYFHHHK